MREGLQRATKPSFQPGIKHGITGTSSVSPPLVIAGIAKMEFDFSIVYDSDEEEFDGLDMYYGSRSLQGVSETIAIATHGIVNGDYVSKTTAVRGFKNDFKTSFEGSFKQRFKITFTNADTVNKIINITPKSYIELLSRTINDAIGRPQDLTRRGSRNTFKTMYYSEDIAQRITPALKEIHTPVKFLGYKATLYAAQTPIASFNKSSLQYLETEIKSANHETVIVGISRFNARTGTGRLITGLDEESFSFVPNLHLTHRVKRAIISSLRGVADNIFIPLQADVTRVTLNDGSTKYFILHDVNPVDEP